MEKIIHEALFEITNQKNRPFRTYEDIEQHLFDVLGSWVTINTMQIID